MDTWNRLAAVKGREGERGKGGEEMKRKACVRNLQSLATVWCGLRGGRAGVSEVGKTVRTGREGDRKRLWGGRQCADDVLLSCTLETCIVL